MPILRALMARGWPMIPIFPAFCLSLEILSMSYVKCAWEALSSSNFML